MALNCFSKLNQILPAYNEIIIHLHTIHLFCRPFIYPKNTTRLAKIVGAIIRDGGIFVDSDISTNHNIFPKFLLNLMGSGYKGTKDISR